MNRRNGYAQTVALQLALVTALLIAAAGGAFGQGTISGVVTDYNGAAVAGAVVSYNSAPVIGPQGRNIAPRVSSAVQADAKGKFNVASLPYADYYLCASGPQPTQIRSCEWDLPIGVAELSSASPSANLTLALGRGARSLMTLSDPGGRVADLTASQIRGSYGGNLKTGVKRGGWYVPATLVSSVNGVRTYEVVVPVEATYQPTVWTTLDIAGGGVSTSVAANASISGSLTTGSVTVVDSDVIYPLGTVQ